MKGCLKIVVIALLLGAGIFFFVWNLTGVLVTSADGYFAQLTSNHIREAYDASSKRLQQATDYANFETTIKRIGLDNYASASWNKRNINGSEGRIEGTVTRKDGVSFPMQVDFEKVDGKWLLLGLRPIGGLPAPPAGFKEDTAPKSASGEQPRGTASSAPVSPTYASNGEVPPSDQLNAMVTDTLMQFNDAVKSNDFTAMYATMARPMKEKFTPVTLRDAFKTFIEQRTDIASIKGKAPEFSPAPGVEKTELGPMLTLKGKYPGTLVNFDIQYVSEDGAWRPGPIHVKVDEGIRVDSPGSTPQE